MDLRHRGRVAALVALGLVAACDRLLDIRIAREATTTVEAGTPLETLLGDMGFGDFLAMDLTSATELENQGVAPGDIVDTRLVSFELTLDAPDGADLGFLDEVDLLVTAPGLPEELVAHGEGFDGQTEVAFEVFDVDLSAYVVSESMTLRTDVRGRRPDDDSTLTAAFVLSVGVTSQGACNALGGG